MKKTTGTHGRRRATRIAPAAAPAHGRRRAKSNGSRRLVQVGGIAAATAGVLAVSVVPMPHPGASAPLPAPLALKITGTATPTVAFAPSDAKVTFERVSVAAVAAPEAPPVPAASVISAASSGPIHVSVPVPVPVLVSVQTETSVPASRLADPVAVPVRTSPFGLRTNPLTGEADEMHHGLDFGAACGTPVIASAEGTVTVAGWHPFGGGNRLEIDHGNGLKTTYNHLERIDVPVGQQMALGSKIATVGTTGNSTGCHLHFEVVLDGTPVDPEAWL